MLFASRESMLEKQDSIAMERILGKNDLFPISYLQTGLNISKAICRISIRDNRGVVVGYGTGFLVSPHILLTNNHVIRSQQDRKSTRLNSSHANISYAVFCLKKKK